MPRVLVMTERTVDGVARTNYVNSIAARRERALAVGANFWVFEKIENSEHFMEFVEATSEETLAVAFTNTDLANNGYDQLESTAPVWREITSP